MMRMRKSGFGCTVSSWREIRRTRSHSCRSRKLMKRASPYSNAPCVATCPPSLSGEQPAGRSPQPGEAGPERLGVGGSALLAPETRRRAHLLDDVDAVVVAQPGELARMRLEHRHLRLERAADVDVLDRLEADPHDRVHVGDRRHQRVRRPLRLVQRKGCVEAALEHELRCLVVVAHVVVRVVRDDQVGTGVAYEVDHGMPLLGVGGVDLGVANPERDVLGAADLRRPPRFSGAGARRLLRRVLEAAAVAPSDVAHDDLVPLAHEPRQRPSAEDLEVVRMRADGENSHTLCAPARSNSLSSTVWSARRSAPRATPPSASSDRTTRGATGTSSVIRRSSGTSRLRPARDSPPPTITVEGLSTTTAAAIPCASRSTSWSTIRWAVPSPSDATANTSSASIASGLPAARSSRAPPS